MRRYVKPIRYYVDVDRISSSIQKLAIDEVLTYLGRYGIFVWKIAPNIFVALDYETKHKDLYRASFVSIPLSEDFLLKSALEIAYGVKLYTEQDLRNILRGLVIHREYGNALGFLIPCEFEVKIVDRSKGVVGIADIVCENYVIEIKTGSSLKRRHIYQLLMYMDLLRKPQGFLVYEDKVLEFSLDENLDLLSEAYERLHEVYSRIHSLAKNISYYRDKFLKKFNMKVSEIIERLDNLTLVA